MTQPRLRFAPSPTGPLHLGGARTALYNWAAARALGGTFVLRIEDTDQKREAADALEIIFQGLRWLGIDWDEGPDAGGDHGPYFQSQRNDRYTEVAKEVLDRGIAYPCYCTPEEVEAGRARLRADGKNPQYDRRCRDLTAEQRAAFEADGREPSIRFKMPLDQELVLDDLIRGDVTVNLKELDDWVMVRRGGAPLYNFACVVDDRDMEITHVVRGEEHFNNGVKQRVLFDALGATAPRFAHIPLILNAQGKKLSKRDADTNMLDYRDKGCPADAVFNYIALLGWSYSGDQDVFTRDELLAKFKVDDIHKSGARFDEEKLSWMCGEYIRSMPVATLTDHLMPYLVRDGGLDEALLTKNRDFLENIVVCYQPRISTYAELAPQVGFLFHSDPVELDKGAQKLLRKRPDAAELFRDYADALESSNAPPSLPADRGGVDAAVTLPSGDQEPSGKGVDADYLTPFGLQEHLHAWCAAKDLKPGQIAGALRGAVSGTNKGAGLFDLMFLAGKEACVARLRAVPESKVEA